MIMLILLWLTVVVMALALAGAIIEFKQNGLDFIGLMSFIAICVVLTILYKIITTGQFIL
jgi:hypothetical protein